MQNVAEKAILKKGPVDQFYWLFYFAATQLFSNAGK